MIYCYHCGYELDEEKLEQKKSSRQEFKDLRNQIVTRHNYFKADLTYEVKLERAHSGCLGTRRR